MNDKWEEWKDFASNNHYLSDEWLEYIIKSDSIISDRGYKEICQSALDVREDNRKLYDSLNNLIKIIDDHGDNIIKAHATKILEARNLLKKDIL